MAISFESEKHEVFDHILITTFSPHVWIDIRCTLDVERQNADVDVKVRGNTVVHDGISKDHPCVSANFSQPDFNIGFVSGNLDICIDDKAKVITVDGSTSQSAYTVHLDKHVLLQF